MHAGTSTGRQVRSLTSSTLFRAKWTSAEWATERPVTYTCRAWLAQFALIVDRLDFSSVTSGSAVRTLPSLMWHLYSDRPEGNKIICFPVLHHSYNLHKPSRLRSCSLAMYLYWCTLPFSLLFSIYTPVMVVPAAAAGLVVQGAALAGLVLGPA